MRFDSYPSDTVIYSMPFARKSLDVYSPSGDLPSHSGMARTDETYPVLVLLPGAMLPVHIISDRKVCTAFAVHMSRAGFCVVVPEITYTSADRIRQSVVDLRLALSWVGAHISSYQGNPTRIYALSGGLASELLLLALVQEAAVVGRPSSVDSGDSGWSPELEQSLSTAMGELEVYAPQTRVPRLAGVISLAGLSDVIQGYEYEKRHGLEHLSILRRWAGPGRTRCILHSPVCILKACRPFVDASLLPPKFLLVHGGADGVVPVSQVLQLGGLLEEAGVAHVDVKIYPSMTHRDAMGMLLTPVFSARRTPTAAALSAIRAFLHDSEP